VHINIQAATESGTAPSLIPPEVAKVIISPVAKLDVKAVRSIHPTAKSILSYIVLIKQIMIFQF
jgi:hypothetical protein